MRRPETAAHESGEKPKSKSPNLRKSKDGSPYYARDDTKTKSRPTGECGESHEVALKTSTPD